MNKMYTKAKIRLDTAKEVTKFVQSLNSLGTIDKFTIEDSDGHRRVDARSFLGTLYASGEFGGEMFLVNETNDGRFPFCIDEFRPE